MKTTIVYWLYDMTDEDFSCPLDSLDRFKDYVDDIVSLKEKYQHDLKYEIFNTKEDGKILAFYIGKKPTVKEVSNHVMKENGE